LDESRFVTEGGGQVLGLGRSAVQAILARHSIDRVLAEEGGRTSRGSLRNMRAYVAFLNEVHSKGNLNFDLGDTSVHVSMSPTEALLRKCQENFAAGKRPIIITSMKGADVAEGMAENAGIADSIDIFEFEQFIATNIHELGQFKADRRRIRINEIVEKYNSIVKKHETDPSLLIEVATGKA
jgi:hypothetical protein